MSQVTSRIRAGLRELNIETLFDHFQRFPSEVSSCRENLRARNRLVTEDTRIIEALIKYYDLVSNEAKQEFADEIINHMVDEFGHSRYNQNSEIHAEVHDILTRYHLLPESSPFKAQKC